MDVDDPRLSIGGPRLRVELSPLGATLRGVWVPDAAGNVDNVVLCHADPVTYADPARNPYLGATVGRYANRIGDARFTLDAVEHHLTPNEGTTILHGGPVGWSFRRWDVVGHDAASVAFAIEGPDGEAGFPGAVAATVTFRVEDDALHFEAIATTTAPTPVSITTHAYWNLAGGGSGAGPRIDDQVLVLAAERVLDVDDRLVPTGATPAPVGDLDLGTARPLGDRRIDHAYWPTTSPVARLHDPAGGRWLELRTDQPSIQVYTGDGLGAPFGVRRGVCLEPQQLPDAPNHPDFPSTTLRPGERYVHRSSYRFGVDGATDEGSGR